MSQSSCAQQLGTCRVAFSIYQASSAMHIEFANMIAMKYKML